MTCHDNRGLRCFSRKTDGIIAYVVFSVCGTAEFETVAVIIIQFDIDSLTASVREYQFVILSGTAEFDDIYIMTIAFTGFGELYTGPFRIFIGTVPCIAVNLAP